jgi:dipeptidyl aminopeptidase/acylaminoacyl peptidase
VRVGAVLGVVLGATARASLAGAAPGAFPGRNGAVAFSSNNTGAAENFDLFRVDPDGTGVRPIVTTPTTRELEPAYSPDGRSLAFSRRTDPSGLVDLVVMRADGTRGRVIVRGAGELAQGATPAPAWSPDGSRVAFGCRGRTGRLRGICTVRVNGRGLRRVTSGARADWGPAWSPDGRTIAFMRRAQGSVWLYRVTPAGTGLRRLSGANGELYSYPAWSPRGSLVAFVPNSVGVLAFVRGDGRVARRVAVEPLTYAYYNKGDEVRLDWSPDGSQLLVGVDSSGIYRVDPVSGSSRPLVRYEPWFAVDPTWQPRCNRAGGDRADRIRGTSRGELLCGLGGPDLIVGRGGRDRLFGEEGNDRILARDGNFGHLALITSARPPKPPASRIGRVHAATGVLVVTGASRFRTARRSGPCRSSAPARPRFGRLRSRGACTCLDWHGTLGRDHITASRRPSDDQATEASLVTP